MAYVFNMVGGNTGSASVKESDVNFYDYDGTLLAGYTISEAQSLLALPPAPDHSSDAIPLTFQSWNYTLSQVNSTTTNLNVGATYITSDSKTHMLLTLNEITGYDVPIYFNKSDTSTLTLNLINSSGNIVWSTTNSNSGNSVATVSGITVAGAYDLQWEITSGSGVYGFGQASSSYVVIGGSTQAYRNSLTDVYCGSNITSSGGLSRAFANCYSLKRVTLPNGITTIDVSAFYMCRSLAYITIPVGVTSVGATSFYNCHSLNAIAIPIGVTSVGNDMCGYCYSLRNIVLPGSITSFGAAVFETCTALSSVVLASGITGIGTSTFLQCFALQTIFISPNITNIPANAFSACYTVVCYDFSDFLSIPSLQTDAFANINTICRMKIPSALYDSWSTATNWSAYINYMDIV